MDYICSLHNISGASFSCCFLSQESAETSDDKLVAKVGIGYSKVAMDYLVRPGLPSSLFSLLPPSLPPAWLEYSPGSLETAASEFICAVDGWKHYLPVPHHDGGDDAGQTCADTIWIQGR